MDNPRSDRARAVASLATSAGRRRHGRFLVEGVRGVLDLLAAAAGGGFVVRALYAEEALLERVPGLAAAASAAGVAPVTATPEVIAAMSDAATPQGVVAVVDLPGTAGPESRLTGRAFAAVLVRVRDPGNVGSVVRAADAAGASFVALTPESADPYAPKAVRASVGSLFHVPVAVERPLPDLARAARGTGAAVLATAPDGTLSLDDAVDAARDGHGPLAGPHLWLLGNEAHGLAPGDLDDADAVVRIPIRGRAESLNLAMAATLVLFASARANT